MSGPRRRLHAAPGVGGWACCHGDPRGAEAPRCCADRLPSTVPQAGGRGGGDGRAGLGGQPGCRHAPAGGAVSPALRGGGGGGGMQCARARAAVQLLDAAVATSAASGGAAPRPARACACPTRCALLQVIRAPPGVTHAGCQAMKTFSRRGRRAEEAVVSSASQAQAAATAAPSLAASTPLAERSAPPAAAGRGPRSSVGQQHQQRASGGRSSARL